MVEILKLIHPLHIKYVTVAQYLILLNHIEMFRMIHIVEYYFFPKASVLGTFNYDTIKNIRRNT